MPKVVPKNAQKVSYSSMCAVVLSLLLLGDISRRYEEYQSISSISSSEVDPLLYSIRLVSVINNYILTAIIKVHVIFLL